MLSGGVVLGCGFGFRVPVFGSGEGCRVQDLACSVRVQRSVQTKGWQLLGMD